MSIILILILIIYSVIFGEILDISFYDVHRYYLLSFLVFISVYLTVKGKKKEFYFTKTHLIIFLIFTFGMISAIFNGRIKLGLIEILHFSTLLLTANLISSVFSKNEIIKFIYRFAVTFIVVYILYFFAGYLSHLTNSFSPLWPASPLFTINQFTGIIFPETLAFSYIRFFNHIQTWTFPLLMSVLLFPLQRQNKILIFIALCIWWALLIQSGGRGTLLAVAVSFLFIMLIFTKNRKKRFQIFFGSLIAGSLFYLLIFQSISGSSTVITRTGSSSRFEMWEKAWNMFLENPILGKGPLSYSVIQEEFIYFAHPHNFYLQVLAEWGLPVCILFVGIIIYGLSKIIKLLKYRDGIINNQELEVGLFWSLSAALLHAGLSQVFHTPLSQLFLIFVLAWVIKSISGIKALYTTKISNVAIFTLILICSFILLNSNNIKESFSGNQSFMDNYQTSKLYPRIWNKGINE